MVFPIWGLGGFFYDTQLGRWQTTDPQNQFASPYLALGNNPVNGTDPNGEFFVEAFLGVSAIFGLFQLGVDAIAGNVNNFGDSFASFGRGFLSGTIWQLSFGSPTPFYTPFQLIANATLSAGSSYLPSYQVGVGDENGGISFGISPVAFFGSHGFRAGVALNANISSGPFSLGFGVSSSYGAGLGKSGNNFETIVSTRAAYNAPHFGFSYGINEYSRSDKFGNQVTGSLSVRIRDVTLSHENDILGDRGDRYRTGGSTISYRINASESVSLNFNVFTGDPGMSERPTDEYIVQRNGKIKEYYTGFDANEYRNGLLSFGYRNGNRGFNVGIDSEAIRAGFQNGLHNLLNNPHFIRKAIPTRPYYQNGIFSQFSLY